jgi:hypothetical protein
VNRSVGAKSRMNNTMKFVDFEKECFFSRIIWLVPIIFLFHVIEESNGFVNWANNVIGGNTTVKAFLRVNALVMIITILLCLNAYLKKAAWATFLLFFIVTAFLSNFAFHMYTQYKVGIYSPGYFTATLLYLPILSYISYLALRERFISWYLWLLAFVIGFLLNGFVIWFGLYRFGQIPWLK